MMYFEVLGGCRHNINMQQSAPVSVVTRSVDDGFDAFPADGCALLVKLDEVHEALDALYSAIEEFKDPEQLARVARVFRATPLTHEAQMIFIQERMERASTNLAKIREMVSEWMANVESHVKRTRKTTKTQQRMERKSTDPLLRPHCDECKQTVDVKQLICNPQLDVSVGRVWRICTRCAGLPDA